MTQRARIILRLMIPVALTLVVVSWPVVSHYRIKGRLDRYQTELRTEGEKLTIADLVPRLSSTDVSAAISLMGTVGQLPSMASNFPSMMKFTSPGRALVCWEQETLANADASNVWVVLSSPLQANADKLADIRELLKGHSPAFNLSYDQGFSLLLPHLSRLKTAAQWLSADALFELHEGRATNALENLDALIALARTDREPLIISELVRVSIAAIGMATSWEALQSSDMKEEELLELQKSWQSIDFLSQTAAALTMERAMAAKTFTAGRQSYSVIANGGFSSGPPNSGLAELTQLGKDMLENPKEGLQSFAHRYPGYWHWKWWQSYDDELASEELIQASLEAVRAARDGGALGPGVKGLEKKAADIRLNHPVAGRWVGYTMANDSGAVRFIARVARIEMERALLVTAVALRRYQVKHGEYPATLSELVPIVIEAVPQDPMDGQPLRYRLRPDGSFLLYSVGDDGQDNGGDAAPDASAPKQWLRARDAVWPVPASKGEAQAEVLRLATEWKKKDAEATEAMLFRKRYGLVPEANSVTNQAGK